MHLHLYQRTRICIEIGIRICIAIGICICIAIGICICIYILAGQPQRKFQDRDLQLGLEPLSCLALIDVSSQGAQQNAMLSLYVLNLELMN